MLVVLAILSVGLLGLIIYFAVSSKSSRLLKLSALNALGLIALSIAVCGVFLIIGPSEKTTEVTLPVFSDSAPQTKGSNIAAFIVFLVTVLFIVGLIIFIPMRDRRKKEKALKKGGGSNVFDSQENPNVIKPVYKEDDSFDIDLD